MAASLCRYHNLLLFPFNVFAMYVISYAKTLDLSIVNWALFIVLKPHLHLKQICLCLKLKLSFLQLYEALHNRKSKPGAFRIP